MQITEKEKHIYNSFLATSREVQNKPFRLSKDFTNLADDVYITLKKISSFFDRNQNINYTDYFKAPYIVYNKDAYYDLDFYKNFVFTNL